MGSTHPEINKSLTFEEKCTLLRQIIEDYHSAVIGYSGGVDSTLLLKVAHDILGNRVMGVIALSPTLPASEFDNALSIAQQYSLPVIIVHSNEIENPDFQKNAHDRCYHCKTELFSLLKKKADEMGFEHIFDGQNADDHTDYRPGTKAAEEFAVKSPLKDAGLTKSDIRHLSQNIGLPTWNKPAQACLSSRIPYGTPVTTERLSKIEKAERVLQKKGFSQFRVRHHENIARIETTTEELGRFLDKELRSYIIHSLKDIGYQYVTIDLEGYRTGSLNETLEGKQT